MNQGPLPEEIGRLALDPDAPLVVVDVDEVLAMFMRGFGRFVEGHGYEMRITRFALFQNIYRTQDGEVLDLSVGRTLFDRFFATDVEHIDAVPGAREALARLAQKASVVVLTNAPLHCRGPRERWLQRHGFPYPMVVSEGPKGPPVAALAGLTRGPAAFIDDLLIHLDSVADAAPHVSRFQHVADERLRPLAPSDPKRHARIDDWRLLGAQIEESLAASPPR